MIKLGYESGAEQDEIDSLWSRFVFNLSDAYFMVLFFLRPHCDDAVRLRVEWCHTLCRIGTAFCQTNAVAIYHSTWPDF